MKNTFFLFFFFTLFISCSKFTNSVVTEKTGCDAFSASSLPYGGGKGTVDNPYLLGTWQQLQNIDLNLSAAYLLCQDIDLAGTSFIPIGMTQGKIYAPFNQYVGASFSGQFDGNHLSILNLTYEKDDAAVGLFSDLSKATVKDLSLKNFKLIGTNVGALSGGFQNSHASNIIIENVDLYAKLNPSIPFPNYSGGLTAGPAANDQEFVDGLSSSIPFADSSTIRNITVLGGSIKSDHGAGGVLGISLGIVSDVVNFANLTGEEESGGIASHVVGFITPASLTRAVNFGNITINRASMGGGIVASTNGLVSNVINFGNVSAVDDDGSGGGLGGVLGNAGGTLNNAISFGSINHIGYAGGAIGAHWGEFPVSGITNGTGSNVISLAPSVTSTGTAQGFLGNDTVNNGYSNSYYFDNGVVPNQAIPGVSAVTSITSLSNFPSLDPSIWTMTSSNPHVGATLQIAPIPKWICGKFGIICQ